MMVINAAYKTLKESTSRATYDKKRSGSKSYSSTNSGTTSSTKSSYSSSAYTEPGKNPFDGYYKPPSKDEYTTTDSLGDIFSDLFSEIRKGGAKSLVEDLLEFLEDQVKSTIYLQ